MLIAIDGTGSKEWLDIKRCNSHVRQWWRDYKGPGPSHYLHGPDLLGFETNNIVDEAWDMVVEDLRKDPSQEINLVGHSRGGLAVIELARRLNSRDTHVVPMPVRVNFMGLYDAVDRALGVDGGTIRNVRAIYHAVRDPNAGSRSFFGNTGREAVCFLNTTCYQERIFFATHSGIGGGPLEGDKPKHFERTAGGSHRGPGRRGTWVPTITKAQDEAGGRGANMWIRDNAKLHGVELADTFTCSFEPVG